MTKTLAKIQAILAKQEAEARRKARLLAEALREEAIEAEERQELEDERRHNASLRWPS